jgi:hypothetical protein
MAGDEDGRSHRIGDWPARTARPPEPILVAPLFRELLGHLLDLLRSLSAEDWHRPTV